ncbi:MAG: glycosyltransferase family 47 protein [Desmonostoc vinosum HA7617-LM4]|jgi:hypothetical protein|nr:glycosyltransferase family 47 protein [Desmonostoc vinosum HA7617-LM4]
MKNINIKIVALQRGPKYYSLLKEKLTNLGLNLEIIEISEDLSFDTCNCSAAKFNLLRGLLKKQNNELTVLVSSTTELFPEEPDYIIGFSGYRSWSDSNRFKIIPFVSEQAQVSDSLNLEWQEKPTLSVGFLGNTYENRKCVKVATHLPSFIKQQFLQGRHLNYIYRGTSTFSATIGIIPCFFRLDALKQLEISNLDGDIIRYAKQPKVTQQEIKNYQEHMLRNTYILCPRAIENYSFRFYETLAYGRVPVLVDTDVVLPSSVDWDEICIKVPYDKLGDLENIVRKDYETRTKQDFIERQRKALKTMKQLGQFHWLQDIAEEIAQAAI